MSAADDEILEVWTDNDQPPTLLRQALDALECRSCHAQPGKPCRMFPTTTETDNG